MSSRTPLVAWCGLFCLLLIAGCGGPKRAAEPAPPAPAATAPPPQPASEATPSDAAPTALPPELAQSKLSAPWSGDLDALVERRLIRALVVYNKTTYFLDHGEPHGVAYDALKAFETELNQTRKLGKLKVHVVFLPLSRDQLLPALAAGRGDIALGTLTVTEERRKLVDFTAPVYRDSSEIVVTGPGAPPIATLADLSGKEVFVRRGGSKHESLVGLNERFRREGKPEVEIRFAPAELEDEDLLEMANAGLIQILVVDRLVAEFWQQVFASITLHPDVAVRTGADIAWAIQKNTPQLRSELDRFIASHGKGTTFGNLVLRKYLKSLKFVSNAAAPEELAKYELLEELFRRYGEEYCVDWLLMAAQGYQESRLDQNVRSPVGAIGVMQLMPATGAEMEVGDVREVEANSPAGVKDLRFMIDRYYRDERMTPLDRALFTFASYNAGPGRVRGLRQEAQRQGLDPNVWFNNVERVAAEKIGQETVTYVSNIYKYYIAYTLLAQQAAERAEAKQAVAGVRPRRGTS